MESIEIRINLDNIEVRAPYNEQFKAFCNENGGKWNSSAWILKADLEAVKDEIKDSYNGEGRSIEVTVVKDGFEFDIGDDEIVEKFEIQHTAF